MPTHILERKINYLSSKKALVPIAVLYDPLSEFDIKKKREQIKDIFFK